MGPSLDYPLARSREQSMAPRIVLVCTACVFFPCISASANDIDCGFFNEIEITDPSPDASPGAPAYVEILGLNIRQIGNKVQFEWLSDGNPLNSDQMYFFIFLDTDFDIETGQNWGGIIGAEVKIGVSNTVGLDLFNAAGDWIAHEEGPPIGFSDEGFVFSIDKSRLLADHFNLYFESSGFPPWHDQGSVHEIQLEPPRAKVLSVIEAEHTVLEANPHLANVPSTGEGIQLSTSLIIGESSTLVPNADVTYTVSHPASHVVSDPKSIISIDANGMAHYISEGFVFATATVDACQVSSETLILATGDVFGQPGIDDVIAVWPADFTPDGSAFSFGHMMSTYPKYLQLVNTAYDVTSEMYCGYMPYDGDTQIFALLDTPGHCGAPNNPLETAPCCYINCGDGSPQYNVVVHEMGHNFQRASGFWDMLTADESKICTAGFCECSASLPIIYFEQEVVQNGSDYGLSPGDFEVTFYQQNIAHYCPDAAAGLAEFESLISSGQTTGIFDNPGLFDGVRVFCSFFQAFSCDTISGENPYHHDMIKRFISIFGDSEPPSFVEEKVESYFGAAYSVAAGRDMRDKLRFWGFDIDDAYYDLVTSLVTKRIPWVFEDDFEEGNLSQWSAVTP
jgi:hypothetical protein